MEDDFEMPNLIVEKLICDRFEVASSDGLDAGKVDSFLRELLARMGTYSTSCSGVCAPTTARREFTVAVLNRMSTYRSFVPARCLSLIECDESASTELKGLFSGRFERCVDPTYRLERPCRFWDLHNFLPSIHY